MRCNARLDGALLVKKLEHGGDVHVAGQDTKQQDDLEREELCIG
jgi:hypothetical protein